MYNVAGVTFGERQKNIEKIYNSVGQYIQCSLNKTHFKNDPAIQVIENKTHLEIGWIPQESVDALYNKDIEKIFGQIGYFADNWYVQLYSPVYIVRRKNK